MRFIFTALFLCAISSSVYGQAPVTRLLVVGDSWAEEQWLDGSHVRVLSGLGLSSIGVSGELTTTSGSTAADWVMPENLARIDAALAQYPHLDTVQLTVGGNDFLDSWNTGFSAAEFDALIALIVQDIQIVTDYILAQRPELEIVVSLYDYPNFEDTRDGLIWTFACNQLWTSLGQPDPLEVNTAAVEVIDSIEAFTDGSPRIRHVRHLGQAQIFFGSTLLPPPGDINLPSPRAAMRERFFGGGGDCFHFNATAYDVLISNLVEGYFDSRFAPGLSLEIDSAQVEYTGQPREVSVTTLPADQALIISYDGQLQAPTEAGSYSVVVTAPGWRESSSGVFEIVPGSQSIQFDPPTVLRVDSSPLVLQASASSGLPVSVELLSGPASLVDGELTLDGIPGVIELQATQSGNGNWQAAEAQTRSIQIIEVSDPLFEDRFQD